MHFGLEIQRRDVYNEVVSVSKAMEERSLCQQKQIRK